jgi:hypothetical protein
MPDPFADHPDWAPKTPGPIVPTPAIMGADLRGRRVVIGLPGLGWRADLRADDRVVQGSRTYVPVMPEGEWYRAESEQTEVFAPLVPIERVWVEEIGMAHTPPAGSDVLSRLVSLDEPPRREHVDSGQERRDLRAVTELHTSDDGDICARVTPELDWYRWQWTGRAPRTLELPVHLLWVE